MIIEKAANGYVIQYVESEEGKIPNYVKRVYHTDNIGEMILDILLLLEPKYDIQVNVGGDNGVQVHRPGIEWDKP